MFKEEYPQINHIVSNDVINVNDCLSGAPTVNLPHKLVDDHEVVSRSTNIHTQPMYDTRTNLTQYPLGDTDINTIFEQSEPEQDERTSVSAESSKRTNESKAVENTTAMPNKTTSIEREYGLKETSIETFDSPAKRVQPQDDDVFYTPAKGLVLGLQDTPERDQVKSDISTSKDDGGSMKEKDLLRTESVSEDSSVKSLSLQNDNEKEKKEENNMMDHYLQMVMRQKKNNNTANLTEGDEEKKQEDKVLRTF